MGQIFDFSGIERGEVAIKKTWSEFREALANKGFSYDEVSEALNRTFLKTYDDLFNRNAGLQYNTLLLGEINTEIGRGCILKENEKVNYERFIPKKEFITSDNRFSPPGVEWLYLAVGTDSDIHECAKKECRAKADDRFGFCHFNLLEESKDLKIVDLTIADGMKYSELNAKLENYGQKELAREKKRAMRLGFIPKSCIDVDEFKKFYTKWFVYIFQTFNGANF